MTNLLGYGGPVWLVTITAPGADFLPWEDGRVEAGAAREWNRSAAKRWAEVHRRAFQATTRRVGRGPTCLARVWQLQRRGVLHVHLVLGFDSPLEVEAARHYVTELRARSAAHGFGFVDARDRDGKRGRATVMEPHRAAGYLARYLGESAQLVQAIALRARPQRLVWVAPRLTQATGCTMARLRRVRVLWRLRQGLPVTALAGRLPVWFRDRIEYEAVSGLLAVP